MDESRLFEFAKSCAKSYCARFQQPSQFDDATQEVCRFLLKNRDKWNRSDGELKWRCVKRLIRWYQELHGLRRKKNKPLVRVDAPLEMVESRDGENEENDARLYNLDLIQRAIRQSNLPSDWVEDLVYWKKTQKQVAAERGVSVSYIARRFARFKQEIERLFGVKGVEIVDAPTKEEIEECPLFSTINKTNET